MELAPLLYLAGVFTVGLGVTHFVMPVLFDFDHAIPRDGEPLHPFRWFIYRYPTTRSDVYGIAWVMNHAASYTLVSIGVLDMLWTRWLDADAGWMLALWIAGFWWMRAGSQLYLGRRRGDLLAIAWFAMLGTLHAAVAA